MTLEIISEERKSLNPCLGFTDDTAFVDVPLLAKADSGKTQFVDCIITSDRKRFIYIPGKGCEELDQKGVYFDREPGLIGMRITARWSHKSISAFLEGGDHIDPVQFYKKLKDTIRKYVSLPSVYSGQIVHRFRFKSSSDSGSSRPSIPVEFDRSGRVIGAKRRRA